MTTMTRRRPSAAGLALALTLGLPAAARAGPAAAEVGAEDPLPPDVVAALQRADDRARRALAARLDAVDAAFAARAAAAEAIADRALGWGARRRLLADLMPGSGGGRLEVYLAPDVDALLPDADELEAMADAVVAGYLDELRGVEGRLLVELRRDAPDLDLPSPAFALDAAAADAVRDRAAAGLRERLVADLRDDLARELVALAAGELAAAAATRTAASAGLRAAAVSSAPATLGIGLAAALAADYALGRAWDRLVDPRATLVRLLRARLDDLRRMLVEGAAESPGLRPTLEAFDRRRAAGRRRLVRRWIAAGGGDR